jgi:hypothetical protein
MISLHCHVQAINSEGFTLWKTHFTRLSGMLRKTGGSLVSIIGCDRECRPRTRFRRISCPLLTTRC